MALVRGYGNTVGHRRPRYAFDADRPEATGSFGQRPHDDPPGPSWNPQGPSWNPQGPSWNPQGPFWLARPQPSGDAIGQRPPPAPDRRYEVLAPRDPDPRVRDEFDARFDVLDLHYDEAPRAERRRIQPAAERPGRGWPGVSWLKSGWLKSGWPSINWLGASRPRSGRSGVGQPSFADAAADRHGPKILEPADRPPAEAVAGNRLLTLLLFVGGLLTSVSLWLFDTQPGSIVDSATLMIAVGRITGLIGGYLLFIQLLMMSRVSWLEEWVGARDLLRWHRWLGTTLLVAVMAHFVFVVFGYAAQSGTPVVAQTWTMLTTFEDMISATIATGLLAGVGLLAIRQIRKRLPYELWHLLHLTGYLVLLLGYGHQVAVGADLSGRFASVFWPGLGALVIAALVWGRVVEPLYLNLRHRFRIAEVVEESDDAYSVYITGRHLDTLSAQAGQFMRWRFLNRDGWWQSHPFSLSAAPNAEWLRLTVTAVGNHTDRLGEIKPGTRVWAEGPFGTFTAERRTRRKALLIAGGSGIAPIRALLEEMPADTVVLYRARTMSDLVFPDELDALAERRGGQVLYVVGGRDEPGPRRLFSADGMRQLVPDVQRRDVYLCGPPGLVEAAVDILRDLEVPAGQLHLDPFEF